MTFHDTLFFYKENDNYDISFQNAFFHQFIISFLVRFDFISFKNFKSIIFISFIIDFNAKSQLHSNSELKYVIM